MDKMREQSVHCETTILTETIAKVDLSQRPFKLWTENMLNSIEAGEKVEPILTKSVIIATGATAKRLHLPGEDKFWQAGISACAVCDGAAPIFRNKPLAVVGGGDTAAEEASYLTKYASKVYMLVRRDQMRASKAMQDRVLSHPKIEIRWNTLPTEAKGSGRLLEKLALKDTKTGAQSELEVNGLFYAIGHTPNTSFLKNESGKYQVKCDEDGYVIHGTGSSETNVEGVFAAGDVADKKYRQAITAAGSGCMAALDCERWLEGQE
jgi:thioredoxin reductase (NADPH)